MAIVNQFDDGEHERSTLNSTNHLGLKLLAVDADLVSQKHIFLVVQDGQYPVTCSILLNKKILEQRLTALTAWQVSERTKMDGGHAFSNHGVRWYPAE